MKTPWRALYDLGKNTEDAVHPYVFQGNLAAGIYALGLVILWALTGWLANAIAPGSGFAKWYDAHSDMILVVLFGIFCVYAVGLFVWQGITEKPDEGGNP